MRSPLSWLSSLTMANGKSCQICHLVVRSLLSWLSSLTMTTNSPWDRSLIKILVYIKMCKNILIRCWGYVLIAQWTTSSIQFNANWNERNCSCWVSKQGSFCQKSTHMWHITLFVYSWRLPNWMPSGMLQKSPLNMQDVLESHVMNARFQVKNKGWIPASVVSRLDFLRCVCV